jgi:hypothetical protein
MLNLLLLGILPHRESFSKVVLIGTFIFTLLLGETYPDFILGQESPLGSIS